MNQFKAGNVKNKLPNWQKKTKNNELLEKIEGAKICLNRIPIKIYRHNPPFTQAETKAIDAEISKLLKKGVIKSSSHEQGEFTSPIFMTIKNDGRYRLILNLKNLNGNIEHFHFKMHSLKEILKMVEKNCSMASLDIKDAYYSIPVDESSQKYLKFLWKERLYQSCVLPNGLSPCPGWFAKLLKPPLAELRKSKHDISAYINDTYLQDDAKENCIQNIIDTITLLRFLGFTIHAERSQFLPIQELDILGFTINSVNMTVSLKKEKKEQLACLKRKTINKKFIKIRKLAQIIGKIVAALPGSRFGALYYRGLYKYKQYGLQKSKYNYEAYVELFQESITY